MFKMPINVLSVQKGTIEENNVKWAKVLGIPQDPEFTENFAGFKPARYIATHDVANKMIANRTVGEILAKCQQTVKEQLAVIEILDFEVVQPK